MRCNMNRKIEAKSRETDSRHSSTSCYTVVGGVVRGRLDPEDVDLYRFMVGGLQAK
ncbi:MAG: hypothetical protein ACC612_07630 [Methanomethylovorans sp.]|uniref:hypothetical protein n=1 Tax=Methanomethylovorans sp. TaxID=2758717 RepID=UPI003530FEEA